VLRRYYNAFASRSSLQLLDDFRISDLKVGVLFILILLNLLIILIVETYKPVLKMPVRINILKMEMFFSSKDGVDLIPVRKAITLR